MTFFMLQCRSTVDDETWWVQHTTCTAPNEDLISSKTIPKFNRVRVVTLLQGKFLCCSCGFFSRHDLPCPHVLCVTGELNSTMCGLHWWKAYDQHFLKDEYITEQMLEIIRYHPPGIPVEKMSTYDKYPHMFGKSTIDNYLFMEKIIHSFHPVVYGGVISCMKVYEEEVNSGKHMCGDGPAGNIPFKSSSRGNREAFKFFLCQ
ncbi:MAG: hypothetical protein ACREBR_02295 [bacterium]